jgi:hypothetical protein
MIQKASNQEFRKVLLDSPFRRISFPVQKQHRIAALTNHCIDNIDPDNADPSSSCLFFWQIKSLSLMHNPIQEPVIVC